MAITAENRARLDALADMASEEDRGETRSRVKIKQTGASVYARDESTEPLCLAWHEGYAPEPRPIEVCHLGMGLITATAKRIRKACRKGVDPKGIADLEVLFLRDLAWMFGADSEKRDLDAPVFSFAECCDMAELYPERIRDGLAYELRRDNAYGPLRNGLIELVKRKEAKPTDVDTYL